MPPAPPPKMDSRAHAHNERHRINSELQSVAAQVSAGYEPDEVHEPGRAWVPEHRHDAEKGRACVEYWLGQAQARCGGRTGGRRGHGHAKLVAHRLQQLGHRELGVEDVGHIAVRRNLLQKAAANGGLAGANVASEQHKAPAGAAGRAVLAAAASPAAGALQKGATEAQKRAAYAKAKAGLDALVMVGEMTRQEADEFLLSRGTKV